MSKGYELKIDSVDIEDIYNHFIRCNTSLTDRDIRLHAIKIRSHATTFEIWKRKDLAGLCACYMNNFESGIAFITHIEVCKEYRHLGLGRMMMNSTITKAKESGFSKIQLEVLKDNDIATAFYLKFGFEILKDQGLRYLMNLEI